MNGGPIDSGRCRLVDAVLRDVLNNAYDFAPDLAAFANLSAKGSGGRAPEFAGEIFREDDDGDAAVEVGPGEVAAGEEACASGVE